MVGRATKSVGASTSSVLLALATTLAAWSGDASAAPKKAKKRAAEAPPAEPYVMIFSPSSANERPQAVVETKAADVPDVPLLLLTMGSGPTGDGGQDVEPEDVGVAEKSVILDKAEVDAPAGSVKSDEAWEASGDEPTADKAKPKLQKKKKKKASAPQEP